MVMFDSSAHTKLELLLLFFVYKGSNDLALIGNRIPFEHDETCVQMSTSSLGFLRTYVAMVRKQGTIVERNRGKHNSQKILLSLMKHTSIITNLSFFSRPTLSKLSSYPLLLFMSYGF